MLFRSALGCDLHHLLAAHVGQLAQLGDAGDQPLAALRTLSGNAVRFLQRGDLKVAADNLTTINDLVDRMGRITANLRSFARRGDDQGQASLSKAVEATLQLLAARLEASGVELHRDFSDAQLTIDQTRLEQILVNLIGNALDAMHAHTPSPQLWLEGELSEGKYHLRVRDNGPGIDLQSRKHLFEPFFTTKPGEQGLGLGLTLSASLAAAAGGSLNVEFPDAGGVAFVLLLPLVQPVKAEPI